VYVFSMCLVCLVCVCVCVCLVVFSVHSILLSYLSHIQYNTNDVIILIVTILMNIKMFC
jgi:hypothetical protein